jgi:hypothetical protein
MFTNKHFLVQGLCYGVLGGVSFTLTAVQDEVLEHIGLGPRETCWTNFAFVLSGVIGGLVSGVVVGPRKHLHGVYLKSMFVLCSVALAGLTVLTYVARCDTKTDCNMSKSSIQAVAIVLMGLAGVSCLGFTGIGLTVAGRIGEPVPEALTGGAIEWAIQVKGGGT